MQKRLLVLSIASIFSIVLLTGCMFSGEQLSQEIDPPPSVQTVSNLDDAVEDETNNEGEDSQEVSDESNSDSTTENRQLYLVDQNGMVVPQSLPLPNDSNEVARQVLEYLVKDGPVTNILPNGFRAVLPAGTEIKSLNLEEDGTLIVDMSEEFMDYTPEEELKIIQSMTFTLTQFDTVDRIKLKIEGVEQDVMPVNGTPLSNGYSRADGINVHVGDVKDITEATATTVYYPSQIDSHFYYVPVTVMLDSNSDVIYSDVVNQLIEGPSVELAGLQSVFRSEVELLSDPVYKDGVLTLTFNDAIFNSTENTTISDEVLSSLVLSLTEQPGVESVEVKVDGVEQVFNENGEQFSKPVSREDISEPSSI
jgi:germination protein M